MKRLPSRRAEPVLHELIEFWSDHPDARGTVEDVVWWLNEHRIRRAIAPVKSALAQGVKLGILSERRRRDGRVLYGRARGQAGGVSLEEGRMSKTRTYRGKDLQQQ